MIMLAGSSVFADEVHFLDGKVAKGKIIQVTASDIEYAETDGKPLTIVSRDKVFKITYDDGTTVVIMNAKEPKTATVQENTEPNSASVAVVKNGSNLFFDFESGWNGYCGLLGMRLDYRLIDGLSINGGLGYGMWGVRPSAGFRYYVNYPFGLAFGLGIAYNTGNSKYEEDMETVDSSNVVQKEKVTVKMKPVAVINLTGLYFFELSSGYRLYLEAGWGFSLNRNCYTYTSGSGNRLSDNSRSTMNFMRPGGIVLTAGLSFF